MKNYVIDNGEAICNECGARVKPLGFSAHWRSKHLKNFHNGKPAWNSGLTAKTDERVRKCAQKISESWKPSGFCSPKFIGSEAHRLMSAKGGGYRSNAGKSKKFRVMDSFGQIVTLQSSYEELCARLLNELEIQWIRPNKGIRYSIREKVKHYYPDFYLPDLDVFLDPKNDYLIPKDADKIAAVSTQNAIKIIVLPLENLTLERLEFLVRPSGIGPDYPAFQTGALTTIA